MTASRVSHALLAVPLAALLPALVLPDTTPALASLATTLATTPVLALQELVLALPALVLLALVSPAATADLAPAHPRRVMRADGVPALVPPAPLARAPEV